MAMRKMTDLNLSGKRVLIRQDLNVPIKDGKVSSDARIRASLPTIEKALQAGAAVVLMSHLGRPKEGQFDPQFSLAPVALDLSERLNRTVRLVADWQRGLKVTPGEVVLLENVRFNPGEKSDDESLAKAYAALCDVYVMDAFGTAHRAQASTHGVARFATEACAGPLLIAEVEALQKARANPKRPLVAIVGGSKVSGKLELLASLSQLADQLIVGGGIANTFLAAAGKPVGKSLYEPDLVAEAGRLMAAAKARGGAIPLPKDVIVGTEISATAIATIKSVDDVSSNEMILDIGPQTAADYAHIIANAGTIIWNGPVGVFEQPPYATGTRAMAQAVAASSAYSLAGGGDTIAAIDQFGVHDKVSYISTGGGAFLEFLEGKILPAVAVLESRAK